MKFLCNPLGSMFCLALPRYPEHLYRGADVLWEKDHHCDSCICACHAFCKSLLLCWNLQLVSDDFLTSGDVDQLIQILSVATPGLAKLSRICNVISRETPLKSCWEKIEHVLSVQTTVDLSWVFIFNTCAPSSSYSFQIHNLGTVWITFI